MIKTTGEIVIVKNGSAEFNILSKGKKPYFYINRCNYYLSQWKAGKEIDILQVEGLSDDLVAFEIVDKER